MLLDASFEEVGYARVEDAGSVGEHVHVVNGHCRKVGTTHQWLLGRVSRRAVIPTGGTLGFAARIEGSGQDRVGLA